MEAQLRDNLAQANARLERAIKAIAAKHKGGEMEEWRDADESVLTAERDLAKFLNKPYAVEIDFPLRWDVGAPLPHLLQSDHQVFLVFLIGEPSTHDGSTVTVVRPDTVDNIAVVEFVYCTATKMGDPNDEVFHGHPLEGSGLTPYTPMKVENSPWIAELSKINSVHRNFNPETWKTQTHFIFGFHDSTFECVAESFSVKTSSGSIRDKLINLCENL